MTVGKLLSLFVSCGIIFGSPAEFQQLIEKSSPICNFQHVSLADDGRDYLTSNVPWSMNRELIHSFVNSSLSLKPCATLEQIIENVVLPIKQYTCSIPWLTQQEIFNIFRSYSMVFWYGDSLTRHMSNALYILLRQDLEFGGYPSFIPPGAKRRKLLKPITAANHNYENTAVNISSEGFEELVQSFHRETSALPQNQLHPFRTAPQPQIQSQTRSLPKPQTQTQAAHNIQQPNNVPNNALNNAKSAETYPKGVVHMENSQMPKSILHQIFPPKSYCSCDAQFSEAKICQLYKQHYLSFTDMENVVPGCGTNINAKCDRTTQFEYAFNWYEIRKTHTNYFIPRVPRGGDTNKCSTDGRPVLFSFQGGGHIKTNATLFIQEYFVPFMDNIQKFREFCKAQSTTPEAVKAGIKPIVYKVHFFVSGVPSVSAYNEGLYPHQGAKYAEAFYKTLQDFLAENYPHVHLLNFLSLTKEGLGSSFDGYHSGTDVNLMRAMIMLNAMKLSLLGS